MKSLLRNIFFLSFMVASTAMADTVPFTQTAFDRLQHEGKPILVDASIVGVCDAFDAMTSTRPYRKGMPTSKALAIIQENLGSQFHSDWGRRFIQLGESGRLNHIVGHSEAGIPLQECPMCGPTIVVSRNHTDGDHVYCRSCGGESTVQRKGNLFSITPTGHRGGKKDLEPVIDNTLLNGELNNLLNVSG